MTKIKTIPRPEFKSAQKLTPLQLNSFRYQKKHTLLTPSQLAAYSANAGAEPQP